MNYHHLSHDERDRLAVLRSQGRTLRHMAAELGRSPSTLARELKRNRHKPKWGPYVYYPRKAQVQSLARVRQAHRRPRLKSVDVHQQVHALLEKGWSPELIAGRLRRSARELPTLSPETIYQWIYNHRPDLVKYLARAHPKRRQRWRALKHRVRIPRRISIQDRPAIINTREEPGHWETDLIVGPGSSALQVSVERTSRYTKLCLLPQRTASVSRAGLTGILVAVPASLRRSITYDNGAENYEHLTLNEDFDMASYFCEPYHSWEKGTVENTNGLIRRFIPKHTRLSSLSQATIVQIENWLNDRPRKVLQFQTPREVFQALVALTP